MCGIAGFVFPNESRLSRAKLRQTLDMLRHRGPDDAGILSVSPNQVYRGGDLNGHAEDAHLVFAHRRLSILDLSDAGRQPMASSDGNLTVVYNGEIYNYLELREELKALGHRFRTETDTEVLLAAWQEWGPAALDRFIGMFAMVIWNREQHTLTLVRDPFGIKPLFYCRTREGFAFASEIKVLLETTPVSRTVHPERLYYYLRYGITDHGAETLFRQIEQIPPGHFLKIDLDHPETGEPKRYWQWSIDERNDLSFDEAADVVREQFLDNVRLHLRSDVPVGAALSGGVDSSSIAMAMRHVGGANLDLHLVSFIADDDRLSEEKWIDVVGRACGGDVHKVRSSQDNLLDDLRHVADLHDEPVGSTSIYAQYRVFQTAQENGITVMLDGQGADELLGGYRTYFGARLASLLVRKQFVAAARFWSRCARLPGSGRMTLLMQMADFLLPNEWQKPLRRLAGRDLTPSWLNAEWFLERGVQPASVNRKSSRRSRNLLREQLLSEIEHLSLPHLLRYEDRNSMAFSIESRVPFLTPQFATLLLSLPEEYLIARDGTSKAVFRRAMRGIVPDAILDRKDKIGFATPERQWLTTLSPWVEETLRSETGRSIAALNTPETQAEWNSIREGRSRFDFRAWRWLNLIEWSRNYGLVYE